MDAGWLEFCHPKFHWLVHLARELEHFGILLSCWVHERKHRMVKRYANMILNTLVFEKSVLSEVTCHHIAELRRPDKFDLSPKLIPPLKASSPALRNLLEMELDLPTGMTYESCNSARASQYEVVHQRDVVLFHSAAADSQEPLLCGEIWQFCRISGRGISRLAALISVWAKVEQNHDGSVMIVKISREDTRIAVLMDIRCALTHRRRPDGNAQIY